MNKVNSPKEMLLAVAQVFEDYPERWTQGSFAKDINGAEIDIASQDAYCFCVFGSMPLRRCTTSSSQWKSLSIASTPSKKASARMSSDILNISAFHRKTFLPKQPTRKIYHE